MIDLPLPTAMLALAAGAILSPSPALANGASPIVCEGEVAPVRNIVFT